MMLEIRNSNLHHQDYFVLLNAIVGRGGHITAPQNNWVFYLLKRLQILVCGKKGQTMNFKMQKKKI